MTILGVDSATSTASAALMIDGKIVAEETHPKPNHENHAASGAPKPGHAEILVPLIASVLDRAQRSFADVTGLAVTLGPGSFTGLRIGLSTVKGLAYGWNVPIAGISTLAATAARVTGADGLICALLDARRRQVYTALFRRSGESLTRITADAVLPANAAIQSAYAAAAGAPCLFLGDGVKANRDMIVGTFGNDWRCAEDPSSISIAGGAARLAEERLRRSDGDFLPRLAPVYLRSFEAESNRKESA